MDIFVQLQQSIRYLFSNFTFNILMDFNDWIYTCMHNKGILWHVLRTFIIFHIHSINPVKYFSVSYHGRGEQQKITSLFWNCKVKWKKLKWITGSTMKWKLIDSCGIRVLEKKEFIFPVTSTKSPLSMQNNRQPFFYTIFHFHSSFAHVWWWSGKVQE